MKHRPRGYRLLPMAGAALIDPRSSLQPPGLPSATAGTHKTGGPTKPSQVLDAPLLCPEPRRKLQKPSHPIPFHRSGLCYLKARWSARTFSEPALPGEGGSPVCEHWPISPKRVAIVAIVWITKSVAIVDRSVHIHSHGLSVSNRICLVWRNGTLHSVGPAYVILGRGIESGFYGSGLPRAAG